MKKTALILAALLPLSASLFAADPAPASTYSITADFPYVSKYVFRGVQYAEGAFQPSVKLTMGDFYAGIWASAPVDKGYELEIDYYGGYNFKLSDKVTLDVGGTLYSYPGLNTPGADKTTFEAYAGLNGSIEGVNLGLYAYNDFTLDVFTLQGNLGYSIPIDDKASLNLAASVGHASPDSGSGYTYYSFGASVPYKFSDTVTFTVGANWASHDISGLDDNHLWVNAGLTVTF
ncbi:MAG TPA: TorF family putative porin [Lacunisphaera sp.]|nr:TorF family putative porin [Lacunisphaera sp.]